MADRTLTINHADGGSETYTINRDKFAGVRDMVIDGANVSVDRTAIPKEQSKETTFGGSQSITVNRDIEPLLSKVVGGAAAAYSLRDLNDSQGNNNVVRVRRESDNSEKDFKAKEVSNGTMARWVNEQAIPPLDIGTEVNGVRVHVKDGGTSIGTPAAAYSLRSLGSNQWTYGGDTLEYESDFSAGVDGWDKYKTEDTVVSAVGGVLRVEIGTTGGNDFHRASALTSGELYNISFEARASVTGLALASSQISGLGSVGTDWTAFSGQETGSADPPQHNRMAITGGSSGDYIEIRNVKVYKTLGDTEYLPSGKYVVQARRSSDDAVKSFTASEVANGTLESWVDADVVQYTSDFSAGTDGWGNAVSVSITGNVDDIAGVDDVLAITGTGSTARNRVSPDNRSTLIQDGKTYTISAEVYIPETNTAAVKLRIGNFSSQPICPVVTTKGQWVTTSVVNYEKVGGTGIDVSLLNSSGNDGFSTTETIYIRNVVITQTTADGHVKTWYDQSGNTNHATQTDTAKQPKIVDGGDLVRSSSGNPEVDFDGTQSFEQIAGGILTNIQDTFTTYVATRRNSSDGFVAVASGNPNRLYIELSTITLGDPAQYVPTTFVNDEQSLGTVQGSSGNYTVYKNGAQTGTATIDETGAGFFQLGYTGLDARVAEFIIYDSDQSSNRIAIEANIGDYYGITAIPAANDTVNGYVQTWYDQSGNGNDAEQIAADKQPKIVGEVTSGEPHAFLGAIEFESGLYLEKTGLSLSGPFSTFSVSNANSQNNGALLNFAASGFAQQYRSDRSLLLQYGDTNFSSASVYTIGEQNVMSFIFDSTSLGYYNGTEVINDAATGATATRFRIGNSSFGLDGDVKEIIIYNSNQSSNRPAIEANIANQYGITLS